MFCRVLYFFELFFDVVYFRFLLTLKPTQCLPTYPHNSRDKFHFVFLYFFLFFAYLFFYILFCCFVGSYPANYTDSVSSKSTNWQTLSCYNSSIALNTCSSSTNVEYLFWKLSNSVKALLSKFWYSSSFFKIISTGL